MELTWDSTGSTSKLDKWLVVNYLVSETDSLCRICGWYICVYVYMCVCIYIYVFPFPLFLTNFGELQKEKHGYKNKSQM